MSALNLRENIAKVIENPWRFVRIRSLAMFFGLNQIPISLNEIISKCNETGQVRRTAFLEIDMMQGTAFPPDEHLFENKVHTLQDIFLQAGILLDIRLDENNIPDLSGPDGEYNDGELDGLRNAHRNPAFQQSGNKWSAYLVVVTRYVGGDMGRMWNDDRRGCAVFHSHPRIITDNLAFLRSAAHEIGHEFNLHHEDGATYSESGAEKLSIMNQTGTIDDPPGQPPGSGWPNRVGLTFREHERTHLTTHEADNVRPGGTPFYHCNQEHKSWHNNIIVD
jgi:hypothetical protein